MFFVKFLNCDGYMSFSNESIGSHGVRYVFQMDDDWAAVYAGGSGSHHGSCEKNEEEWNGTTYYTVSSILLV